MTSGSFEDQQDDLTSLVPDPTLDESRHARLLTEAADLRDGALEFARLYADQLETDPSSHLAVIHREDFEEVDSARKACLKMASRLLPTVGKMSTESPAQSSETDPTGVTTISRSDFVNSPAATRGALSSWSYLKQIAVKEPEFPLKMDKADTDILVGSIPDALEWLRNNRKVDVSKAAYGIILLEIHRSSTREFVQRDQITFDDIDLARLAKSDPEGFKRSVLRLVQAFRDNGLDLIELASAEPIEDKPENKDQPEDFTLEDLSLTQRLSNQIKFAGIRTVPEILVNTAKELSDVGVGKIGLKDLELVLVEHGWELMTEAERVNKATALRQAMADQAKSSRTIEDILQNEGSIPISVFTGMVSFTAALDQLNNMGIQTIGELISLNSDDLKSWLRRFPVAGGLFMAKIDKHSFRFLGVRNITK